jgi:hypothetical protein
MIKFVIKNKKHFEMLSKLSTLKSFFIFDITRLSDIEDSIFFNKVISTYSNDNNTVKETNEGRFDSLNDSFLSLFPDKQITINIHDVAVSSGITTCDLFTWLHLNNYKASIHASDMYSVIQYYGNKVKYFYDADGKLSEVYFLNFYLQPKLTNKFILSKLLFKLMKSLARPNKPKKKIFLFDKKFNSLVSKEQIQFFELDLFGSKPIFGSYDFVRAMNILNLRFFSEEKLIFGMKKLLKSTNEGGILLIGRTSLDGENNATYYQKSGNQFIPMKKVNHGYEFDFLIEKINSI